MWAYNGQTESGNGCWPSAVCTGSASFDMFDGRKLQFFCSDAQTTASADMTPPWELTLAADKAFSKFDVACASDADCPIQGSQQCTAILWDATHDGFSYANGVACYNWDQTICPGDDFASLNENYANTKFSHYTEYTCAIGSKDGSGAMALSTAAAMIITAFSTMF